MLSTLNSTILKKRLEIFTFQRSSIMKAVQTIIRDVVTENVFERGSNLFVLTR